MLLILASVIYFVIGGAIWYECWTRFGDDAVKELDDPRAQVIMTILVAIILWGGWPIAFILGALVYIKDRKG